MALVGTEIIVNMGPFQESPSTDSADQAMPIDIPLIVVKVINESELYEKISKEKNANVYALFKSKS